MKQFLCIVAALIAGVPAAATVYHVSSTPLPSLPASRQFRHVAEAAKSANPGDTVLIHTGIYREPILLTRSGTPAHPIRFEAAPAANVTITGADTLQGWTHEPGLERIYSVAWPYQFIGGPLHAHPDDDYHILIGRAEQVFVRGYGLNPVLRRDQMSRGTFFVDEAAKRLLIWRADNGEVAPDDATVEASTRSVLWDCTGAYITLRGVRFRYAANAAQQPAVRFAGRGDVVEDCIFERTNAEGAGFQAPDQVARRCSFQDNGQMGIGINRAHRLLVTDCLIRNNNTKGFDRGWEAGGEKTVLSRGVVYANCRVLSNRGAGLWFDIGNENCEVHNCLIADNEDAGIFYEISYGLHAHDNVIVGNGFANTPGAWGAAAGICLSSSPGAVIERNLLVGNKEGFDFREQDRTTPRIDAGPDEKEVSVWNHDETIRHNVIADNRDAQTWGWFDNHDERHWPALMQTKRIGKESNGTAGGEIARPLQVAGNTGPPTNLNLEKLKITFTTNIYDAPDGQGIFHWGTDWGRHQYYVDLGKVQHQLGLEQGSIVVPFAFADYLTRDFRVPATSPALKMDCYPRGSVPDVRLGILTGVKR